MQKLLNSRNSIHLLVAVILLATSLGFAHPVAAQSSCGSTYTVQRGDYMMKIARYCGVTYSDLLKANPNVTYPSLIYPGQVLNIPTGGIPATGSQPSTYTVVTGDTLTNIGQRFGLSLAELRAANPGLASNVNVGQVLDIPARIRFASGETSASLQGKLPANGVHKYILSISANQTLDAIVSAADGVRLGVYGADGSTLQPPSDGIGYRGVLPKTQDYILAVTSTTGAVDYGLSVVIPQRITFAANSTSATVTGTVSANLSQHFILKASEGQTLTVSATPADKLQLIVFGVDGTVLKSGMGEGASFSGKLPITEDYFLSLRSASQVVSYTLTVSIPAGGIPVSGNNSYTVKKGDTLYSIAVNFQTTVTVLLRANPEITNKNDIPVGMVLYLPGATLKLSNGQTAYITKSKDSLSIISRQFNVTLSALLQANPSITNANIIYTGQRIIIP